MRLSRPRWGTPCGPCCARGCCLYSVRLGREPGRHQRLPELLQDQYFRCAWGATGRRDHRRFHPSLCRAAIQHHARRQRFTLRSVELVDRLYHSVRLPISLTNAVRLRMPKQPVLHTLICISFPASKPNCSYILRPSLPVCRVTNSTLLALQVCKAASTSHRANPWRRNAGSV